jgi:hypothetical protein
MPCGCKTARASVPSCGGTCSEATMKIACATVMLADKIMRFKEHLRIHLMIELERVFE